MKKHYHICFTSHKEVMFRNEEDVNTFVNLLALASFRTGVRIVLDTEMSNHVHLAVVAEDTGDFVKCLRIRYGKYFNHKYHRDGRLGDPGHFFLELEGRNHICAAYSYILRNGLHHGASSSAFGYPYSSIKSIFASELGNKDNVGIISSRTEIASFLPRYSVFPDEYEMDKSGTFVRRSFEDIYIAENIYGSPRGFLYNMNRLSGEEWKREQETDGNGDEPVTLYGMENYVPGYNLNSMLLAEKGYTKRKVSLSDFDACCIADEMALRKYHSTSVYRLDKKQKSYIAASLVEDWHASSEQASRCLAL